MLFHALGHVNTQSVHTGTQILPRSECEERAERQKEPVCEMVVMGSTGVRRDGHKFESGARHDNSLFFLIAQREE